MPPLPYGTAVLKSSLTARAKASAALGFIGSRAFGGKSPAKDPLKDNIDQAVTSKVEVTNYPPSNEAGNYKEIRITSGMTTEEAIKATRELNNATLRRSPLALAIWEKAQDLPRENAPDGPFTEAKLRFYNKKILNITKEAVGKETAEKAPERLLTAAAERVLSIEDFRGKRGFSR